MKRSNYLQSLHTQPARLHKAPRGGSCELQSCDYSNASLLRVAYRSAKCSEKSGENRRTKITIKQTQIMKTTELKNNLRAIVESDDVKKAVLLHALRKQLTLERGAEAAGVLVREFRAITDDLQLFPFCETPEKPAPAEAKILLVETTTKGGEKKTVKRLVFAGRGKDLSAATVAAAFGEFYDYFRAMYNQLNEEDRAEKYAGCEFLLYERAGRAKMTEQEKQRSRLIKGLLKFGYTEEEAAAIADAKK